MVRFAHRGWFAGLTSLGFGESRRGSFEEGSTEYDDVDRPVAYRRVLNTWAKWVQRNVDPSRTMVFFMSMSPNHIK